jgi:hypothetical protein
MILTGQQPRIKLPKLFSVTHDEIALIIHDSYRVLIRSINDDLPSIPILVLLFFVFIVVVLLRFGFGIQRNGLSASGEFLT